MAVEIRFAVPEDEERIISFIRDHWSGNQTLIRSRDIFRYQYMTYVSCGFVLAEEDGNIIAIKGYVPMNRTETPDIAAALAIVEKSSHPMLNMEIQRFLEKQTRCRMMCSTGLNPNTSARIYPLFRYLVGKLKQYYLLGEGKDFYIAKVVQRPEAVLGGTASLLSIPAPEALLTVFDIESWKGQMPYKDISYLRYRYFGHPFYHYEMFGICRDKKRAEAVLIGREIALNGSKVFRIVDYLGNREAISGAGLSLMELMKDRGWEYIDFYCYGMNDEDMRKAGFVLRDENDPNIIPNYFEPFVQKNVDIWFFCKQHEHCLICKADGDQDRPNIY